MTHKLPYSPHNLFYKYSPRHRAQAPGVWNEQKCGDVADQSFNQTICEFNIP